MAIRAPDTSLKLMQIFSQLGGGLRDVMNPNWREEQRVRQFLLQNPDRARSLARAQERGESADVAEQAMADAPFGIGGAPATREPANVLAAFGLSPEETGAALGLAGIPGPVQQLEEATAEEMMEAGAPEAQAGATVAEAERTTAQAEFEIDYLDELDPVVKAQTENMGNSAKRVLSQVKKAQGEDYLKFRGEVRAGEIPGVSWGDLLLAESNPEMLSALLQREEMAMEDRVARLDALQGSQEFQLEALKTKQDLRAEIDDVVSRLHKMQTGELEVEEGAMRREVQNFNAMVSDFASVFPNEATAYYGKFVDELFGSGIEFKSAPGFLGAVADRPELLRQGLKTVETSASEETVDRLLGDRNISNSDAVGRILMREFEKREGFQNILENLPRAARNAFRADIQANLARAHEQLMTEDEGPRRTGPAETLGEVEPGRVDLSKSPVVDAIVEFFRAENLRPGRASETGFPTGASQ